MGLKTSIQSAEEWQDGESKDQKCLVQEVSFQHCPIVL